MIPTCNQLLQPVLELLEKENHKKRSASIALIEKFNLSEQEKNQKQKGGSGVFENRIGWAFTFLKKAEFIELGSERAVYKISDLGREALIDAKQNNKIIDDKYLQQNSPNYMKNWQVVEEKSDILEVQEAGKLPKSKAKNLIEEEIEDEITNSNFDLEEELTKNQEEFDILLLEKIRNMSWQNFEDFCANLLEKMGYGVASKRKIRSRDGGIDGEILEDELGLKGKIYLQAKQWQGNNKVGAKDMKEFLYNIRGKKGVFITTSDFSDDANSEAKNFKDGFVALINYQELIRLCKKYQHSCKKKSLEIFQLI